MNKSLLSLVNDCKRARHARGWTQADLGRRVGLDQPRVSAVESCRGNPSVSSLLALANALGLELVAVPKERASRLRETFGVAPVDQAATPRSVLEDVLVPDPSDDELADVAPRRRGR